MVTVLKIPFDLGIIDADRRGAKTAPDILVKKLKVKAIDVPVSEDFLGTQESITSAAMINDKIIAIGGDHSITFGLVRAFKEKYPNSCLIILDAHSDCEDDFIPPSHEGVTRAIASTIMSPRDILLIGYRKARTKEETEFIKKNKLKYIESGEVSEETVDYVNKFISKYDAVYLSIDIDVFDSSDAPGTGWPEESGPNKKLLFNLIKHIAKNKKLKNVDLVEVSPSKETGKSSRKTVAIAIEILEAVLHEFSPKG